MSALLYSLIDLPTLTTGRRLYAMRICLEYAEEAKCEALIALLKEAIAHELATVSLEASWTLSRTVTKTRGESALLDGQIDGVIGAIYSTLNNHIAALVSDDPVVADAKKILAELFPEGVLPIIHQPFEEQLMCNDAIVETLRGELAEAAERTGVDKYAERLESLNERFREELAKTKVKETGFGAVRSAQERGNLFVRRAVAVILGTYHQETEEAASMQSKLLSPILEQCDRLRKLRKSRRGRVDIDSDTGEELSEEKVNGPA